MISHHAPPSSETEKSKSSRAKLSRNAALSCSGPGIDVEPLEISNPALISTCSLCFKFFWRDRLAYGPHQGVRCPDCRQTSGNEYLVPCVVCREPLTLNGVAFEVDSIGTIIGKRPVAVTVTAATAESTSWISEADLLQDPPSIPTAATTTSNSKTYGSSAAAASAQASVMGLSVTKKILMSSLGLSKALGLDMRTEALKEFARFSCGLSSKGSESFLSQQADPQVAHKPDLKTKAIAIASWVLLLPDEEISELKACSLCKVCSRKYDNRLNILTDMAHRLTYQQFVAALVTQGGHRLFE